MCDPAIGLRDDNGIPPNSSKASIEHTIIFRPEARALLFIGIGWHSVHSYFGLHDHDALGSRVY